MVLFNVVEVYLIKEKKKKEGKHANTPQKLRLEMCLGNCNMFRLPCNGLTVYKN